MSEQPVSFGTDASDAAEAGGEYVYCIIRHDRVRGAETPA